ncbi:UDP-glucuronosyltransferase [Paenibacillus prosopidis]|uniref:UDP-glucuronosyltransferase n=1 Tax=Paenibacillus prosopidis TaxID=630520 RepID=A0A368VPQ8_9BACL|nr:UDP-glucuronosyltransferase [Paenibacillus prosopidis]RCW43484.1 hypothetical protein DFP97_113157 [Paenibacillus prosopidis]
MTNLITILCSGFGLGFYIPGLLIERSLRNMGYNVDVEVFENLMMEEKKLQTDVSRKAYTANFAVAKASQRIPGDIRQSLDPFKKKDLIGRWEREGRSRFISLSGHWVHILDELKDRNNSIQADLLYVDSELSPSWKQLRKHKPNYAECYREIGLYDPQIKQTLFRIDVDGKEPLPISKRNARLVVHGGGWGIGTFREAVDELEQAGYSLDVVAYGPDEINDDSSDRRYFMNDPDWRTWQRSDEGVHTFPPFGQIINRKNMEFQFCREHHGLYKVLREAAAVISKPGAGALIDSLSSSTPLILLDPFGPHEEVNADIWVAEGFGIRYEAWRDTSFDKGVLERLHHNLVVKRKQYPDYAAYFAKGMSQLEGRI